MSIATIIQFRLKSIVFLIAAFLGANAVGAEETYPTRFVNGWEIYGWNKDCWMKSEFQDETEFLYSWDPADDGSYLKLSNPKWKTIEDGKRYRLRFEIDDWSFSDEAGGINKPDRTPGISFFVNDKESFMAKLAVGKAVHFYVDEKFLGGFNLSGSYNASLALARCANTLRYRKVDDPFAK